MRAHLVLIMTCLFTAGQIVLWHLWLLLIFHLHSLVWFSGNVNWSSVLTITSRGCILKYWLRFSIPICLDVVLWLLTRWLIDMKCLGSVAAAWNSPLNFSTVFKYRTETIAVKTKLFLFFSCKSQALKREKRLMLCCLFGLIPRAWLWIYRAESGGWRG